jgi:uncharacterized oxidoreductase
MQGNTILVTGGTSGIGQALAAELLARGNIVLVTGRSEERLAATRATLPGVHTFLCDQSDLASIERACGEIVAAFPTLNMLINNAGIGLKRNLNNMNAPLAELDVEIRTNLIGPLQLIQQLLPQLKRQPRAMIANVTSGLAFVPMPLKPIYCATKAAMHSYTQSLRVQLARTNVAVIELVPPATDTDFNKGQEDMNTAHLMSPTTFARAAVGGMEAGKAEVLPGLARVLRLLGRINPRATLRRRDGEQMGATGAPAIKGENDEQG